MNTRSQNWLSVGVIAVITLVSYGVLIPGLGFYRDDWYLLWAGQSGGSEAVIALFQSDRPLIGYLFAFFYGLLGATPLGWHLLALLFRLIASFAFLWLARQMFPGRRREALLATILFSVYPGFVSQPNAGVFVIHLSATAASVLSFALTAAATRTHRPAVGVAFTILSLALAALYLGSLEYMIGLEAARPGLIAYMIWNQQPETAKPRLGSVFRLALPYLALTCLFAYWRLFLFQSTRHATNLTFLFADYATSPLRSLAGVLVETLKDGLETTFFAWIVPLYRFTSAALYADLVPAILWAIAAAVVAGVSLRSLSRGAAATRDPDSRQTAIATALGAWMVLAALLPINAAGRNVLFEVQWDRYALPAALGASLVIAGLISLCARGRAHDLIIVGLVAASVVVHYFSAAWYRDFWTSTRDLWWQMIWRAPAVEQGTMLFIPGSEFAEGYEVYGPANLIYYPDAPTLQLGAEVLNAQTAAYLQSAESLQHLDRGTIVPDNYDRPLIAAFPRSGSCLHVLDGRLVELPGFVEDSLVTSVAALSQVERIGTGAVLSGRPVFLGSEPPHTWCYYYQKVQLARQSQDWGQVAELMDEAQSSDLRPLDPSEWLPAVEAFAATGRLKDARRAAAIVRADLPTRFYLCAELNRVSPFAPPYDPDTVRGLVCRGGD